jgi:antitoxin CptB
LHSSLSPSNPIDHAANASVTLDAEGRRLLWRCRRGMKELDVLLERFARSELAQSSDEQRRTFARFLELPDPLLVDYLLGQVIPPEPELAALALRIASPTSVAAAPSCHTVPTPPTAASAMAPGVPPPTAAAHAAQGPRGAVTGASEPMAVVCPVRHDPAPKRPP